MNPNKLRTCQWLIKEHEKRGDKVIVFSDSLLPLHHYAALVGRDYIDGSTRHADRLKVIH